MDVLNSLTHGQLTCDAQQDMLDYAPSETVVSCALAEHGMA